MNIAIVPNLYPFNWHPNDNNFTLLANRCWTNTASDWFYHFNNMAWRNRVGAKDTGIAGGVLTKSGWSTKGTEVTIAGNKKVIARGNYL